MILIIDNYDSFTYNLYQLFETLGAHARVAANDDITVDGIRALRPEALVISPGPKRPSDSGISREAVERFYRDIPVLGVCLGHQCIAEVFGAQTVHARSILHGKTSDVYHDGISIFRDVPSPFDAARYHSLSISGVPEDFVRSAWADDGEIMGIRHRSFPLFGIQFHPESFMTPEGALIIGNFLDEI
jgi:anthranilate synthase/aminodeoxychorismate synthase-like glutamine amidotransferase